MSDVTDAIDAINNGATTFVAPGCVGPSDAGIAALTGKDQIVLIALPAGAGDPTAVAQHRRGACSDCATRGIMEYWKARCSMRRLVLPLVLGLQCAGQACSLARADVAVTGFGDPVVQGDPSQSEDPSCATLAGRTVAVATGETSDLRPVGKRDISHVRELQAA